MKHKATIDKRLAIYSIIFFVLYTSVFVYSVYFQPSDNENVEQHFGIDYLMLYTAGQTALTGDAEDIFDVAAQHLLIEENYNKIMPSDIQWFYPPTFLLTLLSVFSILPYQVSLVAWLIITLGFAVLSAYLILPDRKNLAWLMMAFPGVLYTFRWGQNSFFSTALLMAGIGLMKTRPALAGLMFGLLTFKPQLAVFPFIVLLITKEWKALKWSVIFGGLSVVVSLLLYGPKVWLAFLNHFFNVTPTLLTSIWEKTNAIQPTMNSALKLMGIDGLLLNIILVIIFILISWATKRIWEKTERMTLRGSAMVIGLFTFIPYFIQYDLMLLSIPFILLIYDLIVEGYKKTDILIMGVIWLMPLVNMSIVQITGLQISPFVCIGLFIYVYSRASIVSPLHSQASNQ